MKRYSDALIWGLFIFLAGLFLLLNNLEVLGTWGELILGGLFALAGLGFLIAFFAGVRHWWRAIPAFTLLGIGAVTILSWRGIDLGEWDAPIVLFGVALGFWATLLVRQEHWWALVPAGVLTVVGVLFGVWTQLDETSRLAALLVGIGVVFLLLYLIRVDERDARWAAVPAGALLLLGIVTIVGGLDLQGIVAQWWPLLWVLLGILVVALSLIRGRTEVGPTAPLPAPDEDYLSAPAPGASVTTLPSVEEMAAANPMPWESGGTPKPADSDSDDIYDVINKQPKN